MPTVLAVKLVANAVLLYGLALLCGGRIRFRGIVPALSVAVFLVPINVFMVELVELVGVRSTPVSVFVGAAACHGVMLYALSYVIPRFTVDNFRIAVVFAALMGVVSLFLNFFLAGYVAGLL